MIIFMTFFSSYCAGKGHLLMYTRSLVACKGRGAPTDHGYRSLSLCTRALRKTTTTVVCVLTHPKVKVWPLWKLFRHPFSTPGQSSCSSRQPASPSSSLHNPYWSAFDSSSRHDNSANFETRPPRGTRLWVWKTAVGLFWVFSSYCLTDGS